MRILIRSNDVYTANFVKFSIRWIRTYGISSINKKKLLKSTKYFQTILKDDTISSYDIVVTGFRNLVFRRIRDGFIIEINPNIPYKMTNAKLDVLCKTIDQGNLELKQYPIFTDTFQFYCDKIKEVYQIFKLSGGI